jgi:hypothetical protein
MQAKGEWDAFDVFDLTNEKSQATEEWEYSE